MAARKTTTSLPPRATSNASTGAPPAAATARDAAHLEPSRTPAPARPRNPRRAQAPTPTPATVAPQPAHAGSSRVREETPLWARRESAAPLRAPRFEPTPTPARVAPPPKPKLVRGAMTLRRLFRRSAGPAFALGLGVATAVVEGRHLSPAHVDELAPTIAALAIFGVIVARTIGKAIARVRRPEPSDAAAAAPIDLELGLLLVTGAMGAAAHLPGGLDGPGIAFAYVATAVIATFATRAAAWGAAAFAILLELAIRLLGGDASVVRAVPVHALGILAFGALNGVVLKGRIDAIGHRAKRRYERELERVREQARSFRLHDAPKGTATKPGEAKPVSSEAERTVRSGVEEIQLAVRFALDLLKRSLGAHTAILLFEAGATQGKPLVKLCEVVSDAKTILEGPFSMGDGVLGAVARRKGAVALQALRPGYRIPYYPQPLVEGGVSAVVAAPILEAGQVRGVLCVDRLPIVERGPDGAVVATHDRPFSAHEEELVVAAARYVLRAIENERVFGRLERAKAEQDHLYAATQRLQLALTEAEVIEAGVESARAIASFDLAAITIVHHGDGEHAPRSHEVRAVAGAADFESLVGLRFGDNGGLVAQSVRSRCTLPHRGDHDPATQIVFTRRHPLRIELADDLDDGAREDADGRDARTAEVRSILVVPLVLRDRALGTLVLGARRRGAFRDFSTSEDGAEGGSGARTTLEVLASHIATSLANARMFAKLEELATTDGLTGLLNKRVLLELGAQKVRAAARYGKPLSVIQTDIDHFKKVNDTHGHDVGDQVIKGLAGILRRLKRGTDYVARFGGEEFVIICEETDAAGAVILAERVREELARTMFHAGTGPFQVTCSLGVATMPGDGATWDELYKATDDALYASKRTGRNRTTVYSTLPKETKRTA
jgi:diguanylate cyclase (GGDEF)-like protein